MLSTVITMICTMKLHYLGLGLHVFDFYFYQRNGEIFRFLIDAYLPAVLVSLATPIVGIVISVVNYRRDAAIKTSRSVLVGLSLAAIVVACATDPQKANDQSYHLGAHRTSSFFVSLSDLRFLVADPAFVERLSAATPEAGFHGLAQCPSIKSRPDIVAVLMKSAVPVGLSGHQGRRTAQQSVSFSRRRDPTFAGRDFRRRHLHRDGQPDDRSAGGRVRLAAALVWSRSSTPKPSF